MCTTLTSRWFLGHRRKRWQRVWTPRPAKVWIVASSALVGRYEGRRFLRKNFQRRNNWRPFRVWSCPDSALNGKMNYTDQGNIPEDLCPRIYLRCKADQGNFWALVCLKSQIRQVFSVSSRGVQPTSRAGSVLTKFWIAPTYPPVNVESFEEQQVRVVF